MKIDLYLNFFINYIKENYDLSDSLIQNKYEHTLRVAKLIFTIASKMNLNEEEIELAYFIGLCHDLGRFREVIRSHVFNNLKFDHAAYSNKILFNDHIIDSFDFDEETKLMIRKALYFHNKKDINRELTDYEDLFVKLIRDADKIDILNMMARRRAHSFQEMPSPKVLTCFLNNQSIDLKDLKTKSDRVLLYLGFALNLYFLESKELLHELGYVDDYISGVSVNDELKEFFDYIVSTVRSDAENEKVLKITK